MQLQQPERHAGTAIDAPPLGRLYDVGGRDLMLHRSGSGGPSVVFVPGAGLVGLDYLTVHDRAAELTTSVLYDRAGTGWSDRVELPRAAADAADELRRLLRVADVPAPYLLAGHSLGAFYVRRYAQLFPDEVAGILLLDPGHEDIFSYLPEGAVEMNEQMRPDVDQLPDLTDEQIQSVRGQFAGIYAQWPDSVRVPLIEHKLTSWRTSLLETANEAEVFDELRQGGGLPDVPLIVLTALGRNPYWTQFMSEQQMQEAHDGIRALHAAMASSVSQGEHRSLEGVSHQYLHAERPDAVLDAIRDLLGNVDKRR